MLSIYTVGIVAGGFSNNISFLLASRIIQGVGLAEFGLVQFIRDIFHLPSCNSGGSIWISIFTGSVVGLLAGASIIQNFGWHYTFFMIVPFALAVTIMIAKFVRENKETG